MMCESLVLSQFNYCSQVYGPCLDAVDAYRIQKVQNACLRYIFKIRKYDHITYKLKEVEWLNMRSRFKLQSLTLYHRVLSVGAPHSGTETDSLSQKCVSHLSQQIVT